ncbi:hypothetical protein AM571_PC00839 (plasmid) [Rhizobium etli 8C-3]|uniref:Uncharacterized protein n=1 Tax=Rhizobium etli 8C-3 TaxID=538025 RepID=A0A1L5PF29_RHIET|nr:hypothetical protein AM571_PC00839 [Rhizobium etli 8C-3]
MPTIDGALQFGRINLDAIGGWRSRQWQWAMYHTLAEAEHYASPRLCTDGERGLKEDRRLHQNIKSDAWPRAGFSSCVQEHLRK